MSTSIAAKMRAAREKKGLTQVELSRLCGVSQPTISQIERGVGNPRVSVLQAIGAVLDVRPDVTSNDASGVDLALLSLADRQLLDLFLAALPKMSERERYGMRVELESYEKF